MKKTKLYWLPIVALLFVSIVWLASQNHGYVLIVRPPYRIQISLNLLLILFIFGFFGLHYSLRFINFLQRLPANRRSKKEAMRLKAGNTTLLEGMHALAEGDFAKAEASAKLAQTLIQNSDLEKLIKKLAAENNRKKVPLE